MLFLLLLFSCSFFFFLLLSFLNFCFSFQEVKQGYRKQPFVIKTINIYTFSSDCKLLIETHQNLKTKQSGHYCGLFLYFYFHFFKKYFCNVKLSSYLVCFNVNLLQITIKSLWTCILLQIIYMFYWI